MGKAASSKKSRKKGVAAERPMRSGPNWLLLGLAVIGMGLTAYLTFTFWAGQAVAGCTAGSGCDLVLSSQWSKLFGLPTSFWGFLTYAALGGIAFIKEEDLHWKFAWTIALFGVLYSLYLTSVSVIVLEAACPYCLTSLTLMLVILGLVTYQRPASLPKFSWRPWLLKTVSTGVVLVIALHLHYAGVWGKSSGPEDPTVRALAEHLTKTGAKFYGAFWCPACESQKELFGSSMHRLPYVECSPAGRRGPPATICTVMGIETFPTWIINGQRIVGRLSLSDLARHSNFKER
jgi:uncharacterized membrane protein